MKFSFRPALRFSAALALAAAAAPLCLGLQRTPRPDSTQRELQRTFERELLFSEMQELAARRGREEIIELSGRLKKSCEHLHKAAQKSH
jgi:hypothetical protein